ncbi:WD40 repeat-containing protein [Mycoavidus cysteinexigens]|uniref:WD40 repeat-containing protein n=1 Tax=Mycoavidus cysteinexigens TaxID=1553431 RepID=A0A2Z6EXB3_9BURK|nr:NACHT domain-containing protein [Mycoavidus cysteinexigens]BBE09998.1 WD40 repeat-containing protein [Mycoavidus cysteinexigens]GAM53661.1 hypothetical protein EBME_2124 [bacterium endosymbiont of Mortierella elongata FMR23-6]GLR01758.1 hypothetical protein GCM10007934_15700 [Mycoavidus cysteinexigens]
MSPINPSQSTLPSLASYLPRLASSFSDAGAQIHSAAEIYDAVRSVMQINYGLINIPTVGSHNEITVHYHSTGSDAQLLREILRPLQSMAMQPNNAPLASLGIEGLQKKYLESLQKDREIKDALAMYVAPECTLITNTKERFSLEAKVRDFLISKEKKVLLLLGVAGSGKSTFNRYLARSLWEAYDREANKSGQTPIPLFISLSSLKEPNSNLILEYLKKEGFTKDKITDLKANYRFIFILDGYDEIKDRTRLFYIENELDEWRAKVIITSRPEYLGDRYERQFHPKDQAYLLQTYQLAPFSDLSIEEYVNKYKCTYPELEKSVAEHGEILERSEVKELIRNPFLLKLSLSELPVLAEKYKASNQHITRLALYDQFVESWFERSQDRLSGIRLSDAEQKAFHFLNKAFAKHGTKFSKDLAIEMYQAGLVHVKYSEQLSYDESSAATQDWRDKFFSDSNEKIKLLRFNAPLICRDEQFEFIHKSVQDYLVARSLWEGLAAVDKIEAFSWFNRLNIVNDPTVLLFLTERVQQEPRLEERLLRVIEQSKGEEGVQFERGAANAITVLVRAGVQFNGEDFSGIHIPGAKLMQGVFDSVNFSEADLSNVHLTGAWLRNAKFDRAQLSGIEFNEFPALNFPDSVNTCHSCYSPDERWIVIALNNVIEIYDARTLMPLHVINGHEEEVKHIEFSPDGKYLVSVSHNYSFAEYSGSGPAITYGNGGFPEGYSGTDTIKFWSIGLDGFNLLKTITKSFGQINGISFSPNGAKLASGSHNGILRLWGVKDNDIRPLKEFQKQSRAVNSVAFSSDGKLLASGGWPGWGFWEDDDNTNIKIWLVEGDSTMPLAAVSGHKNDIERVVFSPSGNDTLLASVGSYLDKTVKLWLFEDNNLRLLKTFEGGYHRIKFSKDSGWIVSAGNDNEVKVWPVQGESVIPIREFRGHRAEIESVTFSNNDTQILSSSNEGMVKLWSVGNIDEKFSSTSIGHRAYVRHIASVSNGQFASCSEDNVVKLWSISGNKAALLRTFQMQGNWIDSLAFLSNKNVLLATRNNRGFSERDLLIFLIAGSGNLKLLGTLPHRNMVGNPATSCSGKYFYYAGELWAIEMERAVRRKSFRYLFYTASAFSPDETLLARAPEGKMIELLEVEGNKTTPLKIFKEKISQRLECLLFSPDQSLIALGGHSYTIDLWSITKGTQVQSLKGHTSTVVSIDFSSKGNLLASGSLDDTAKIWDIASGTCLATLGGAGFFIESVVWYETDEGKYLLTGGRDHIIRLWQVLEEGHRVIFRWASHQNRLTLDGASIEGAQGLTSFNQMLLEQKMAKGKPAPVPLDQQIIMRSSSPAYA